MLNTNFRNTSLAGAILWMALFAYAIPASSADFVRSGNKVISGAARFDVLSPTLIRMQYSTNGFVDAPTAIVTNRGMKCTDYTAASKDGWLAICTSKVQLRYRLSSAFTSDTLRAVWTDKDGIHQWTPGCSDEKNLGGPPQSFNSLVEDTSSDRTLPKFPDGFLSRSGCYLMDDSISPTWDEKTQWIVPRPKTGAKDLYLFVYGSDYKSFFKDYTKLAGKIPMIPRYVLGACITDLNFEYSNESAQESRLSAIVERFRKENIPLDTLAFDYGWHKGAWEALDWSPAISDPSAFLNKMKSEGIKVGANDHPGTLPMFDSHGIIARDTLGLTVTPVGTTRSTTHGVYMNLAEKDKADLWAKFHDELYDQGISFWWIDGDYALMDGLNSQMWTNRLYYESQEKHSGVRSFVLSRYGGPGNHRYPAFFTGDCHANWKVLSYELPMALKAGNVLVPYVSNDITGFYEALENNFELYARWIQWGSMSPILRLHSTIENPSQGNARLPWNYGQKGDDLARRFFKLRYRLIPYFYTYCREAYDTGMPICRALYLEYPEDNEAYNHFDEYLLGRNLLIAPITAPAIDGVSARSIYLPAGKWIDYFTGKSYKGNEQINYVCTLDRMPVFVRKGSVIPMQPDMQYTTQKPVDPLILDVYSGGSSTFSLYEDDGLSLGYKKGEFCWTKIAMDEDSKHGCAIRIAAAKGEYNGQPKSRAYLVNLHCARKPRQVSVDGKTVREADGWKWDESTSTASIRLSSSSITQGRNVSVKY